MKKDRSLTRIVFIGAVLIALCSYKAVADEEKNNEMAGNLFLPPAGDFFGNMYISPFLDPSLIELGAISCDYSLVQNASSFTLNLDVSIAGGYLIPGVEFIPLASGSVDEYLQNVDVFMDRYNKVFLPSVYNIPAYRAELEQVSGNYMRLVLYKHSYPARFFSEAVPPNLNEEEKSIIVAWQYVENIAREAWLNKKNLNGIIDTIAEKYPEENLSQNDSLGSVESGTRNIFIEQSKDSQYLFNVQISDEDGDGICESLMLFFYKRPLGKDHNQLVGSKKIRYYPPVGSQCRYRIEELYTDFNGEALDQESTFKVESEVKQIGYNYEYDEEYYMKNSKGEYVSVGNFVISHLERVENDRMSAEVSYYKPGSGGGIPDPGLDLGVSFGSLLETVIQTPSYTIRR